MYHKTPLASQLTRVYPGTLEHIQDDADTFASWGVDMLKLDGCCASKAIFETGYPNMTMALNRTGRPIVFSCSWPAYIEIVSVACASPRSVQSPNSVLLQLACVHPECECGVRILS